MKLEIRYKIIGATMLSLLGYSCKIADISEQTNQPSNRSTEIASIKLMEVVNAQGFEIMAEKNVYQFEATDDWPGLTGKMAKLWPDQITRILFKHNFNTFDGSAAFLNGKKQGQQIGIQSWKYYEKENTRAIETPRNKKNASLAFGLVVFHYFLELPYRLSNAPIKKYYGERTKNGTTYDLVFVSWEKEQAHPEHDQYIIWINQETKLIDYCIYTLRDNTNPLTRQIYGSIAYENYTNIDGFWVPFSLPIMLNDGVITNVNTEKYFHKLSLHSFSFGGFTEEELYPIPNTPKKDDHK